jgi:hypothetical protein
VLAVAAVPNAVQQERYPSPYGQRFRDIRVAFSRISHEQNLSAFHLAHSQRAAACQIQQLLPF